MVKSAKHKGIKVENKVVKMFNDLGIQARRQPYSGAKQDFPHDVQVNMLGGLNIEVKARSNGEGFKTMERWQGGADLLVLVADNEQPRVQMRWDVFRQMLEILRESNDRIYKIT